MGGGNQERCFSRGTCLGDAPREPSAQGSWRGWSVDAYSLAEALRSRRRDQVRRALAVWPGVRTSFQSLLEWLRQECDAPAASNNQDLFPFGNCKVENLIQNSACCLALPGWSCQSGGPSAYTSPCRPRSLPSCLGGLKPPMPLLNLQPPRSLCCLVRGRRSGSEARSCISALCPQVVIGWGQI